MSQQERRIHISEFCALVYRQQEDECARSFDDAAAEAEWRDKPDPQQPDIHLDSIASANIYEGFDDKPRPIDAVPAYFAKQSGVRYEDAIDYIWRAGHGCQWGGLKRVSGEVRRDLSKVAQTLSAYFRGDAMRELLDWFVGLYPQEADEMGLPASSVGWPEEPELFNVEHPAENPQGAEVASGDGAPTPAGPVSLNADERPDDLMYLNVVCKRYVISKSSIFRHIKSKDKKLKNWPELTGNKFRVSKAEVELLYEPRATRN